MFKLIAVFLFAVAAASAKPLVAVPAAYTAPLAYSPYSAPLVAGPGVVTATSSQVVARNYNGIAAPVVAASAPLVAAPGALPYTAYPGLASPYAAYSYPYASPYAPYVF